MPQLLDPNGRGIRRGKDVRCGASHSRRGNGRLAPPPPCGLHPRLLAASFSSQRAASVFKIGLLQRLPLHHQSGCPASPSLLPSRHRLSWLRSGRADVAKVALAAAGRNNSNIEHQGGVISIELLQVDTPRVYIAKAIRRDIYPETGGGGFCYGVQAVKKLKARMSAVILVKPMLGASGAPTVNEPDTLIAVL